MRTRQRRRRAITVTTPRGKLYAVPKATPLACLAHAIDPMAEHVAYMRALLAEKPSIALSIMVQAARFARKFTQQFRSRSKGARLIAVIGPLLGSVCSL